MRALILGLALSTLAAPAFAAGFTVTSPDIANGATIGMAQASTDCKGENRSPALSWSGEPAGTQSFAVTMYDPDTPSGNGWWHWTVFNIPASVHLLPDNAGAAGSTSLPPGAGQGRTDSGLSNYGGPCPPPGAPHHYVITVYALKVPALPLDATASGAKVGSSLRANALAEAKITGLFGRPK